MYKARGKGDTNDLSQGCPLFSSRVGSKDFTLKAKSESRRFKVRLAELPSLFFWLDGAFLKV